MKASNQPLKGNIHYIETLGAFDGPGIRYVLFLQGCLMRCKFCHNRDSWSQDIKDLMTTDEVLADFRKYKSFYKKGGLTVSGGEPTLQIDFLTELFKKAKQEGIHTCLDTSAGLFNQKDTRKYDELIKYTDLVLLDLKHMDNQVHEWLVGVPNHQVLEFAKYLRDAKIKTVIRHVLIPGITDSEEHLRGMRTFIDTLDNVVGIDVLPYHKKGIAKWEKMGLKYELSDVEEPTKQQVLAAERILKSNYKYMITK